VRDSSAAKSHDEIIDGERWTVWTIKQGGTWKARGTCNGKEIEGSSTTETGAISQWRTNAKLMNN
jgi:hypothetical protein